MVLRSLVHPVWLSPGRVCVRSCGGLGDHCALGWSCGRANGRADSEPTARGGCTRVPCPCEIVFALASVARSRRGSPSSSVHPRVVATGQLRSERARRRVSQPASRPHHHPPEWHRPAGPHHHRRRRLTTDRPDCCNRPASWPRFVRANAPWRGGVAAELDSRLSLLAWLVLSSASPSSQQQQQQHRSRHVSKRESLPR